MMTRPFFLTDEFRTACCLAPICLRLCVCVQSNPSATLSRPLSENAMVPGFQPDWVLKKIRRKGETVRGQAD